MKQKTDIRARRQHSTVPVDEMCPPSPSYRAGSQAPQFDRDRPKHTPPVSAHHTRRTTAQRTQTPQTRHRRNFPTPRRSEAPLPSYREHGRTFPNQRANAGS